MNDPFPEELLSAYLDGELPREQRTRVEEWLLASADHRRLFDDLQAIRRELQALPQQSLDTGFSDRVLAVIRERSGDASPPAASGASAMEGATQSVPIEPASLPPRHLGMPAWRWFAAGVAATLLAVIVGVNTAPETMAQIGKLAQVRSAERKAGEEGAPKQTQQPMSVPAATVSAPTDTAGDVRGAEAVQRDGTLTLEPRSAASKDAQEGPSDNAEIRKEAAAGEGVERQADALFAEAPNATISAAPGAIRSQAGDFDRRIGDSDGGENSKQDGASPPVAATFADQYENVVELPVTSQQADRALAYAQTMERESVRRSLSNVDTVQSLAAKNATEYAAARSTGIEERETVLQNAAAGLSLMKLMDATAQGVQIAALEVTGTEDEVQSLLDSLGVAPRDLRPERSLGGGGAGGGLTLPAAREGEPASGAALPAGPGAKPAASALDKAKADGVAEESSAAKEARNRRNNSGRSFAGGGFPTVKLKMQSGFGGADPQRDQARGARDPQQEALDASQPQLRVRLVIVPQPDPIDPAIEVKPPE